MINAQAEIPNQQALKWESAHSFTLNPHIFFQQKLVHSTTIFNFKYFNLSDFRVTRQLGHWETSIIATIVNYCYSCSF